MTEFPADPHEPARAEDDTLPLAARTALVSLLTHRFLSRAKTPEAWAGLRAYEGEIRQRLSEMFLDLIVDTEHEVAFKRQSGREDVPVLLRREKPLSRDASLLLVFLRREHAFTDAQDDAVVVSRDQLDEFLSRYHEDSAQDEVRSHRRVGAAIAAVERLGLLTPEPEDAELFAVSPAIVPLITAEELLRFEQVFLAAAAAPAEPAPPAEPVEPSPPADVPASTNAAAAEDAPDTPAPGTPVADPAPSEKELS